MYADTIAAVKVGNGVSSWFCIKFGLFGLFDGLCLKEHRKAMGDHGSKWEGNNFLTLNYADNLSILDGSVSVLEVLRNQGAGIGLKIDNKKTKSLRLGISEDEKMTLGNKKIDQVGSFPLAVLLVRTLGAVKILKVE